MREERGKGLTAVLLCAGYATRMGELTANFPKTLLPVAGRPILDDLVDQLLATGRVGQLVVVTNHRDHAHFVSWRAARVAAEHPDAMRGAPEITLLDDGTMTNADRLGAIGDLAFAIETLALEGPLLVVAGDNLFRFDFEAYLEDFERARTSMVLLGEETDPARLSRSGVAEIDAEGRLLALWEKPVSPPSQYVCPPVYLLSQEALDRIGPCRRADPTADAPGHLIAWLAPRIEVRTHRMRGKRLDVGDVATYERAGEWLRSLSSAPSELEWL